MNFQTAVASCFSNYATLSGRARRSEYWYFVLFHLLAQAVTAVLDIVLFPHVAFGPINTIASLVLLMPSVAVSVRRLHDIGRTGWWLLLGLIPLLGQLVLLIWACQRGEAQDNRFGPPPADPAGPAIMGTRPD
jgi:uncharacterized membrane protein YhaH (DUF805 family)